MKRKNGVRFNRSYDHYNACHINRLRYHISMTKSNTLFKQQQLFKNSKLTNLTKNTFSNHISTLFQCFDHLIIHSNEITNK